MAEIDARHEKIKGVIIEAAGDFIQEGGAIRTDKDAIVSIRTLKNYRNRKGDIIQGEQIKDKWWEKSWIQIIVLLKSVAGVIGLFFLF